MTLSKEEYEYLSAFDYQFHTALANNYTRIDVRGVLAKMAEIYERVFKTKSKMVGGCNKCVLTDIKRLARVYFEDKAEYDAEKASVEAENKPVEASVEEKTVDPQPNEEKPAKKKKAAKNKKK